MSNNYPIMPFGKHKGTAINEIPTRYLRWLLRNTDISGDLKQAVEYTISGKPIPLSLNEQVDNLFDRKSNT